MLPTFTARVNGLTLFYSDVGDPTSPTVLFLHAFPLNSGMWLSQQKAIQDKFRAVAFDFRGFGQSELGDGQYALEFLVDDLIHLLDHLSVKRAVLCGLSMGGYVALRALQRNPERVAALILADSRPASDTNESKIKRAATMQVVKQQGLSAFAEPFIKSVLAPQSLNENPELVGWLRKEILAQSPQAVCAAMLAMTGRTDTTEVLKKIQVPTLVVTGEHDAVIPASEAKMTCDQIPKATLQVLAGAGHLSNLEKPTEFNRCLVDFLAKL